MITSALLRIASRQFGVVDRRQLSELDISTAQLSRARRAGLVTDVTSRTFRLRSAPDTFLSRCTAVSLHLHDGGFLGGPTAGRLHGLRGMPHHPISVVVPSGTRPRLPNWVDVRRTNWFEPARDRRHLPGGAVAAEPHRMLYDLAAQLDDRRFQRAALDCWHLGIVSPLSAAAYLTQHRRMGKDGTLRMARWLEVALDQARPTEGGLELDLIEALRSARVPEPDRRYQLNLPDGTSIRLDLAWPALRLCVEPGHSWWHGGDEAMQRDDERRLAALAVGWETIQLDESIRRDPHAAAVLIEEAYRQRAALLEMPPTPAEAVEVPSPADSVARCCISTGGTWR